MTPLLKPDDSSRYGPLRREQKLLTNMPCKQQESSAPQNGFLQSLQNLFKLGKPKGALGFVCTSAMLPSRTRVHAATGTNPGLCPRHVSRHAGNVVELRQALLDAIAEGGDVEAAAEALAAAKPPRAAGSSEALKVGRDPVPDGTFQPLPLTSQYVFLLVDVYEVSCS